MSTPSSPVAAPALLTPLEAFEVHVRGLRARDVDSVIGGYADDAVMIADGTAYRGREAIRPVLEGGRDTAVVDGSQSIDIVHAADVIYVSWRARGTDGADLAGCETFVIVEGAITVHTGFHTLSL